MSRFKSKRFLFLMIVLALMVALPGVASSVARSPALKRFSEALKEAKRTGVDLPLPPLARAAGAMSMAIISTKVITVNILFCLVDRFFIETVSSNKNGFCRKIPLARIPA